MNTELLPSMWALGLGALAGWLSCVLVVLLPQNILNEEAQWLAEIQGKEWQATQPYGLRACAAHAMNQRVQCLLWVLVGSGLACALVYAMGASWRTALWGVWLWTLLTAAAIDTQTQLLPDLLTQPLLWLGLLIQTVQSLSTIGLENALWGAVTGYLILWVMDQLYLRWRGVSGVGQGDMKLLAAIGAWLGPQAAPNVLLIAALASLVNQGALRLLKPQASTPEFAFGPWIALAAIGYWLWH
jgi:leader peptidase (prepilin peptidase)/N-methyltransferase